MAVIWPSMSGAELSMVTPLLIIAVTVCLVLLAILCMCERKTGHVTIEGKDAADEPRVSLSQLQKLEDIETKVTESNANGDKDKGIEIVVQGNGTVVPSSNQPTDPRVSQVQAPVRHSSPCLPPRNPHPPLHFTRSAGNPISSTTPQGNSLNSDAGARRSADSTLVTSGGRDSDVTRTVGANETNIAPDYEEVDFQRQQNPPPQSFGTTSEYEYIDVNINLREKTADQPPSLNTNEPTTDSNAYAQVHKESKTLQADSRPDSQRTDNPPYAKVNKTRISHSLSANLVDGLKTTEGASANASSNNRPTTQGEPAVYAQVDKSVKTHDNENKQNTNDVHKPRETSQNAEPEYSTIGAENEPSSDLKSTRPKLEDPGYSTIGSDDKENNSNSKNTVPKLEEPGYSTIGPGENEASSILKNPVPKLEDPGYSTIGNGDNEMGSSQNSSAPQNGTSHSVLPSTLEKYEEPEYSTIADEQSKAPDIPDPGYSAISKLQNGNTPT